MATVKSFLSMLVESQHTTGSWECNFFGSVMRKILINIEQMIIHRFVNSWARVIHGSHEQGSHERWWFHSMDGFLEKYSYRAFSETLFCATSWMPWLDESIVASQLCHNTMCCSKAHYSWTTWYKQPGTNRQLSLSALHTWSNGWYELRIQKNVRLSYLLKYYTANHWE